MSKYTVQLRTLIENGVQIFDFDYPIFDAAYKPVLEQKIIDWYYFREIGLETPAQFKHFLKAKMNMIMPYYNQWYSAQEVFKTYDPYKNKNVTQTDTKTTITDTTGQIDSSSTGQRDTDTTSTGQTDTTSASNGTSSNKETFSDTPQAKIQGLDYATNYTENDGTSSADQTDSVTANGTGTESATMTGTETATSTGNIKTTDEYVSTIAGHDGMKYPTDILLGLRQTFVNLDKQIIEELSVLFLNIA